MSLQSFSKDFAKQFRNECELYTPALEYKKGNLRVRQFNGDHAEMAILGERLAEKFFNTHLICQILLSIKHKAIPASRRLFNKVLELKNESEASLHLEPYTANYYNGLIHMLDSYSKLIISFKTDFEEQVYGQLNKYCTDILRSDGSAVAESSSLTPLIELTEFYLKNILAYYNYFIVSWQNEANNNKGIALTTHLADNLQGLMLYTEDAIACIENTHSLLLVWGAQMEIKEEQELYN